VEALADEGGAAAHRLASNQVRYRGIVKATVMKVA